MTDSIEIIPGESIGPIKLGMTREQIEQLGIRPSAGSADRELWHYPMTDAIEETVGLKPCQYPLPGVEVYYDESDRCHRLAAILGYLPCAPVFTLCGHIVNGIAEQDVASILRSIANDVSASYGSIYSLSAGIRAIKWEASDEEVICIEVMPKKLPQSSVGPDTKRPA